MLTNNSIVRGNNLIVSGLAISNINVAEYNSSAKNNFITTKNYVDKKINDIVDLNNTFHLTDIYENTVPENPSLPYALVYTETNTPITIFTNNGSFFTENGQIFFADNCFSSPAHKFYVARNS